MNTQTEIVAIAAARKTRIKSAALANDPRPTIRIVAGEIERTVDEAEAALIRAKRGLYQRSNAIVCVAHAPAIAAHGREIVTLRIFERGDHALLEDLAASANFAKYNKRLEDWVAADPPMSIVKTLKERVGRLRFPILSGIVSAPTMRADGSILSAPGYDNSTGLLFEPRGVTFPSIEDLPTRADAETALAALCNLIKDFPFVAPHDRAVALSAILTACVRPSLPTAPLHGFTAPAAGTGKSKLVDIASVIALGHEAPVIAQGATEEEMEKRLGSTLLSGDPIVAIDNVERPLCGELLCQMLTQTTVRVRILGVSQTPELSTATFAAATGNNIVIRGDLTRRSLLCKLDAKIEQPETRVFDNDPVETSKAKRADLVVAALTILRAYHVAGRPSRPDPLGSFGPWSDLIRAALMWLGAGDPVASMSELRKSDPVLEALRAVMRQWHLVIGQERVTTSDVIGRATEMRGGRHDDDTLAHAEFRNALLAVGGKGGALDSRSLGNWLSSQQDKIVDGFQFVKVGDRQGVTLWVLNAI